MNRIKSIIIPISIVVLLAVLAGVSFANSQNGKSAALSVSPQKGDIIDQLRFSGKVQSENTFDLGFQVSGKVAKVYAKVGDKVQKGKLLAELNSQEATISYSQALSDQEIAQAQLEQARYDESAQKAKLKSVEKSSTANKYDEKYQKEIENQSGSNIIAKEASLRKANESVQNSKLQIDKTKLYAPIDGIITKQSLAVGEVVYFYTPVISLIGNDALEIDAYVSEIEVAKIFVGDRAKLKIDASQTEDLEATISAIDPVETNSSNVSSYKVTFVPSFSLDNLKSGMMVDITLTRGEKKNVFIIPLQSVFEENGKSFVLTLVNGIQTKKEVQLGVSDQSGNVEVLSGVGERDEIVSFNQSK